jgi:hypothetical protein
MFKLTQKILNAYKINQINQINQTYPHIQKQHLINLIERYNSHLYCELDKTNCDVEKFIIKQDLSNVVDIQNKSVKHFVDFAQRFCFNAPYLATGKSYQSDNGGFMIEYLPTIIDAKGKELTTPARISRISGRIQVSKKQFDQYTVPMRFAILCHEFSHFYVNEDMADESEADMNGLLIYLGLGYPRIEAFEAFLEVFEHYPSQENKRRYDKIKNFINNFEKDNIVFR